MHLSFFGKTFLEGRTPAKRAPLASRAKACSGWRIYLKHCAVSETPVTVDHYATLGLSPKAEDVVIRAAYLALMRRYHPDKDGAPASSDRAQAIIAAFDVLGEYKTRVRYDWARRREAEELARPLERRLSKTHWMLVGAAALSLLVVPLLLMRPSQADDDSIAPPPVEQREPAPARPSQPRPVAVIEARPVERPLAAAASVPVAQPDEMPRPAAVAANVAAPLPALKKTPPVIANVAPVSRTPLKPPLAPATAKVDKPALAAIDKCSSARPGVDKALCKDDNLAALDRLGEAYYGQSVRVGSAAKRAALKVSRDGFLGRREACRSDSCLRDVYLAHMKEISAIVENKQPAPR